MSDETSLKAAAVALVGAVVLTAVVMAVVGALVVLVIVLVVGSLYLSGVGY